MFVRSPVPPPVQAEAKVQEVHDAKWFKEKLLEMHFCPVHVAWHYEELFSEVPEYLMDGYIHYLSEKYRQGLRVAHVHACVLSQHDYDAKLLHPWSRLG